MKTLILRLALNHSVWLLTFLLAVLVSHIALSQEVLWRENPLRVVTTDVAADRFGNIYTISSCNDPFPGPAVARFGDMDVAYSAQGDAALAAYDSTGAIKWVRIITNMWAYFKVDIETDDAGNVYVLGSFDHVGAMDVAGETKPSGYKNYLVKYSSEGVLRFAKFFGYVPEPSLYWGSKCNAFGMAIKGNFLYLTGGVALDAYIGDTFLDMPYQTDVSDVFICKADLDGNFLWTTKYSATGSQEGRDIAVDNHGNIFVTGYGLTILKYDANGQLLQSNGLDTNTSAFGQTIGTDKAGNVYVARVATRMTISKYNNALNLQWTRVGEGPIYSEGFGMAVDDNGTTYCTANSDEITFSGVTMVSKWKEQFVVVHDQFGNVRALHEILTGTNYSIINSVALGPVNRYYLTGGRYDGTFLSTHRDRNTYAPDSIAGPKAVGINTESEYSVTAEAGHTYQWNLYPEGVGQIVPQENGRINIIWGGVTGNATVSLRAQNEDGESPPITKDIQLSLDPPFPPVRPVIFGQDTVDSGTQQAYYIQYAPRVSYQWTITPDYAGTMSVSDSSHVVIQWASDFIGSASVSVTASNAYGSSEASLLTTVEAPLLVPAQPTGLVATVLTQNNISLKWNATQGAMAYEVERKGSTSSFKKIATVTTPQYLNTGLTSSTVYQYRIRASNNQGYSAYSGTVSATTFSNATSYAITPASGSTGLSTTLTVTCKALTGASTYYVEICANTNFTGDVRANAGRISTFENLNYGTTYYIRVFTDLSDEIAGPITSFKTRNPESYVVSPGNNATNVMPQVVIKASPLNGASTYTIEANTASDFTGTSVSNTSSEPNISFSLSPDQTYYVRVQTSLAPGVWGTVTSFTTVNAASMAYIEKPVNGATGISPDAVYVTVHNVPGASSYTIQLSTNAGFTTLAKSKTATRGQKFGGLAPGTLYYVRASTDVAPGQWGPVATFTTANAARMQPSKEVASDEKVNDEEVVLVYPNPFRDHFTLHNSSTEKALITILDILGRRISQTTLEPNTVAEAGHELSGGGYIVVIKRGGVSYQKKVFKQD